MARGQFRIKSNMLESASNEKGVTHSQILKASGSNKPFRVDGYLVELIQENYLTVSYNDTSTGREEVYHSNPAKYTPG